MPESRTLRIASHLARTAAIEDKIQLLVKKYKVPEHYVENLLQLDPTGGSFLEWIVWGYKQGDLPKNSAGRIRNLLTIFARIKKSPQAIKSLDASRDINLYHFRSLEDLVSRAMQSGVLESNREKNKNFKSLGSSTIYNRDGIRIIQIGGPNVDINQAKHAACLYAWNTKWCTSTSGTAANYLKVSPLYVIFRNGEKVAQYTTSGGGELMDVLDKEMMVSENIDICQALLDAGVPLDDNTIDDMIGYGAPLNEETLARIARDPRLAVIYARDRLKAPWPEAEPMILGDIFYATYYAHQVLNRRWPELENIILEKVATGDITKSDFNGINNYERYFFPKSVWPEYQAAWDRFNAGTGE